MNTVLTKIVSRDGEVTGIDVNDSLAEAVIGSLLMNNTFIPGITRVVFNTKTEELVAKKGSDGNPVVDANGKVMKESVPLENPILVTVVYFADGTKVTVKNSDKDSICLAEEKVKLSDGTVTKVMTASRESREIGLVYAIAKRLVCEFDEDGKVKGTGFAKFLNSFISGACVQDVEDAKASAERKISKAKSKACTPKKEHAPKMRLRDVVSDLSNTVRGLSSLVSGLVYGKDDCGKETPSAEPEK